MSSVTCHPSARASSRPTRPAPPRTDGPVKLTRRGRVLVRVLVVAAVLAVALFALVVRGLPASSSGTAHHPRTRTVVVRPGQTVWDIARRLEPGADPRTVVAQIEQLNSLSDPGDVQPGEPLFVPTR